MLGVTPRWRTIRLGLIWMILKLALEFGLGHYVLGDSLGACSIPHRWNELEVLVPVKLRC